MTDWSALQINIARINQRANVAELKRRTQNNASIPVDATVVANGLEITTSRIPEGSLVEVHGSVDTTLSGVELRATVTSSWEGECRRCLDLVSEPIELDLVVPFLPGADGDDDADVYPINGDVIDVGEVIREQLMLALPLSPLCRNDCDGADPERFPTDGIEDADDEEVTIDPRWAGLSALTFDED